MILAEKRGFNNSIADVTGCCMVAAIGTVLVAKGGRRLEVVGISSFKGEHQAYELREEGVKGVKVVSMAALVNCFERDQLRWGYEKEI